MGLCGLVLLFGMEFPCLSCPLYLCVSLIAFFWYDSHAQFTFIIPISILPKLSNHEEVTEHQWFLVPFFFFFNFAFE